MTMFTTSAHPPSGKFSLSSAAFIGREVKLQHNCGSSDYRARYYDDDAGRFISEDPITFSGGINFYRYAKNNPGNWVDPFGLSPGAPAIPFPIPWIPPYPIVSPIVRGVGGLIGLILGELAFPDATGIDDARAIPKTNTPPPCSKDKDQGCETQYENDSSVCRMLPDKNDRRRCWASAFKRYTQCLRGQPTLPLDW